MVLKLRSLGLAILGLQLTAAPITLAGEADVVGVEVAKTGAKTFSFSVTLRHGDTGWKHYANKWEVVGPNGKVLGTRILHHPHVNEQPFTRSLSGVRIDKSITQVSVRAYDSKHGAGGATKTVTVPH